MARQKCVVTLKNFASLSIISAVETVLAKIENGELTGDNNLKKRLLPGAIC